MPLTRKERRARSKELHIELKRMGNTATSYRWTEKMIPAKSDPEFYMSWGFCRAFDFELKKFTHTDMPGSMAVKGVSGNSNMVLSDTTGRIARNGQSVRRQKLAMHGD